MNEFVPYGLGFLTVFRLIAMFGRERVPVDEPVKVDGERVISDDSARDPTRITRRHFVIALRALGGVAASAVLWRIYHQNHQVVPDGIYRMAGWAASCVVTALLLTMLATLGGTARSQRVLLDILLAGVPAAWLAAFGGPLARCARPACREARSR